MQQPDDFPSTAHLTEGKGNATNKRKYFRDMRYYLTTYADVHGYSWIVDSTCEAVAVVVVVVV